MSNRILVAMSGGVDSSVAAYLLQKEGHHLCGVTMRLFRNEQIGLCAESGCCSLQDVEDAREVAWKLGFDHYTLGFTDPFYRDVIERFAHGYASGVTPNPCVDCNRRVRFPMLLQRAAELEMDAIATGHYARIEHDAARGRWLLRRAKNRAKDQSYVLYSLKQDQLARVRLPLGDYSKDEARAFAQEAGLRTAAKPDSQDICFVPDGDYAGFLTGVMKLESPAGDFIRRDGQVVGRHRGCIRYTIGQRRGLGIAAPRPLYVLDKDMDKNLVIVGEAEELLRSELLADDLNWIAVPDLTAPMRVEAKIRYNHIGASAEVTPLGDGRVRVRFDEPQRAVAPGQAVVFYDGDDVVGGGTILREEPAS